MIESDTGKKNAQKVTISITILEFPVIPGYGTKPDIFAYLFLPQYIDFSPLNLDIGRKNHADLGQATKIAKKRNT